MREYEGMSAEQLLDAATDRLVWTFDRAGLAPWNLREDLRLAMGLIVEAARRGEQPLFRQPEMHTPEEWARIRAEQQASAYPSVPPTEEP